MIRLGALILTVFTGFSGLAYEVTWQKYLATLLGAHSEATAAVLGIFLGSLSLGYWLFGALTRRLVERGRRASRLRLLLLVYGAVEAAIGVYALLFPGLFPAARAASVWLPTGAGGLSFLVDVALAALLIGPPAILMGGTIPILTQALARSLADATRSHALVYAFNTLGAFLGALAAGLVLIPWLGLDGVMRAMGAVNLAAGAIFPLLGLRRGEVAPLHEASRSDAPGRGFALFAAAALLVGFAMMAVQTILIRVGALALGASQFTFSMVVAVFVLCIAVGSLAVSALPRVARWLLPASLWILVALLGLLHTLLEYAPYWAAVLRSVFRDVDLAFHGFQAAVFLMLLVSIGPAVAVSGAVLPLLFHAARHELGSLGDRAGRLYSLNTLGSLLGALLGGYLFLFWLDLDQTYRIAVAAVAAGGALVTGRVWPRIGWSGSLAALLVVVVVIGLLRPWRPELLGAGLYRNRTPGTWSSAGPEAYLSGARGKFVFYDDDPTTSVAVVEFTHAAGISRSLRVNGKSDGNTRSDLNTTRLLGLVPALFADRAESAFVIGYGTGLTAGALAALEETRSVTVAEISPAVIRAAPLFDFANADTSQHPEVEQVRSDAYRALVRSGRHYDVIVSEPSNPWVNGVEMLYSREFLERARERLTPGGVYAQWYHVYDLDQDTIDLVLRTYAAVFEHVAVWSPQLGDLLLLGFRDPAHALDLARLERRLRQPDFRAGLEPLGIGSLPALLVHEILPLGVVHAADLRGPVHTLYHPRLSFQAGRAFFIGSSAPLPFTGHGEPGRVGLENSLLRRYLARFPERIPETVWQQLAGRTCERRLAHCATLLAQWKRVEPGSRALREQLDGMRRAGTADSLANPALLSNLRIFLGEPEPRKSGYLTPALAQGATTLYRTYHYHPLPFDPASLVRLWQRCRQGRSVGPDCAAGLRFARSLASGGFGAWLPEPARSGPDEGAAPPPG